MAAGDRDVLVELEGVDKAYDDVPVLRDINLAIRDGELITLLGPSGSGKTTVLRLIGGLTEATRGRILLDGRDIAAVPINRRPFNTVFQDYALFPHLNVERNVGYGLMVRGVAKAERRARVAEALQLVALEPFAERHPAQLSGGQRQRVALARAIICQPRLILLDEPLSALDAELRRQMQAFLKHLQQEIRTTFLFVTHDQEEAISMADRICVMNEGEIIQLGTPHELYYQPANEYVARFLGDNNLIDATLGASDGAYRRARTRFGDLVCAVDGQPSIAAAPAGQKVKLAVRPEAIRLAAAGALAACDHRIAVRIEEIGFVGPTYQIRVRPVAEPSTTLLVKLPSQAAGPPAAVGEEVEIGWQQGDCRAVAD
jgi:spermidine/putrescine transport system ATP-binding protein